MITYSQVKDYIIGGNNLEIKKDINGGSEYGIIYGNQRKTVIGNNVFIGGGRYNSRWITYW